MDAVGVENLSEPVSREEETDEQRSKRLQALFDETDADLADVPRKPWPKDDPIVEKFRRKGLID